MIIRPAGACDRQAIAALHAASWRDSYRAYLSESYFDTIDESLGRHWQQLELGERDLLLIAQDDGGCAGFILARDGEPFFINTLHVAPSKRSGGYGRALMAQAARRMQDYGRSSAYLDVITGNSRAIAFYARLGGVPGAVKDKLVGGTMVPNLRIDFPDLEVIVHA